MSSGDHDRAGRDRLMATWVELAIRLGVLGLLIFLAFTLVRPFITIAIWSVVLTVALYPVYDWMVGRLGGRRRLAAGLITILNLLIVIGPATWLTLGLIDSLRNLSEHFDLSALALPPPPEAVKDLAGHRRHDLSVLGPGFDQFPGRIGQDRPSAETRWRHPAWDSPRAPVPASSSSSSPL